ncbi:MAG: hypothetical protein ACT6FC_04030 [Methanosarcinaceae archaeon]
MYLYYIIGLWNSTISNIARLFNISRQAVSSAFINMNKCIEVTLLGMAQSNQIEMAGINIKRNILFGNFWGSV